MNEYRGANIFGVGVCRVLCPVGLSGRPKSIDVLAAKTVRRASHTLSTENVFKLISLTVVTCDDPTDRLIVLKLFVLRGNVCVSMDMEICMVYTNYRL